MLADRWEQIDRLFHEALPLSVEIRGGFLESACAGDIGLRREVESLLKCHEESSEFLLRPALEHQGRVFGPYRVVREISRGGMGIVYLAERIDQQFEKQVAIKIVPELFVPEHVRSLIESEVRILAGFEHSNIARLLDAGISLDGFRWMAMEFIDGSAINQFVNDHEWNERDRLILFQKVCSAVQYSHNSLIVHCDLKPSNVLVTQDGEPKLVDFGIARIMAPGGSTATLTMAGAISPGYASPEQIAGKRPTTAADIFSLGAVLYEILTGKPFRTRNSSWDEVARSAVSEAPLEGLSGDLRLIVSKAVRVEPGQRYVSAAALSDDIGRYLQGEPILARPDSAGYRLARFVGRHRWGVGATAAIVLLCAIAVIIFIKESRVAERRYTLMRGFSRGVLWDLSGKLPNLAGNRAIRREMLQTGVRYLDTLAIEAGGDQSLSYELATGYFRAADAFMLSFNSTGYEPSPAAAAPNYSKAIHYAQQIGPSSPESEEAQNIFISASASLGAIKKDQPGIQASVILARKRHADDPSSVPRARVLAAAERLAATDPASGFRRALAVAEETYRVNPNNVDAQRLYFENAAQATVAMLFAIPETAWEIFDPAAQLGRDLVAKNPSDQTTAYLLATALAAAGNSHSHGASADLPLARAQLVESIAVFDRFTPDDPTDYEYRAYSAMARMSLSYLELRSGTPQAAIRNALEGLDIMKPFEGSRYKNVSYRLAMGGLHAHAARAFQLAHQMTLACQHANGRSSGPCVGRRAPCR